MPSPPVQLHRRFWRLTILNILSNLTVPLAGLVDTAMLGHLAQIRFLAGAALAAILFDYVYWSLGFLRMGTTGTTAQAVGAAGSGEGGSAEIHLVLYRSLVLALGIGAALVLLQVPLREVGFALLTGEPGVEAAGRDYFGARIWGAPATLANFAFVGWFLGREESGRVLAVNTAGNLANVLLNYLFIIRLGMAARGAGLATAASQYLMLALALAFFATSGRPLSWRWREVLEPSRLVPLVRLNGDIFVRSLLLATSFALFLNLSSLLGTLVLAANTILMRLFHVAAFLVDGAAFAAESLAGIFRGARDPASFHRLMRLAHLAGLGLAGLFLAGLFLFPQPVYRLLTSHAEVVALAHRHGPWLVPVLLFGATAFIYDGIFLGITAGRALRNAMLLSTLGVFLPLALAALVAGSVHLLWLAFALFMAARTATLGWAGRREFPPPVPRT